MLRGRDILSIQDFSKEDLENLFKRADEMNASLTKGNTPHLLEKKLGATLFFEPSTRTRLSFQTAIKRLGGQYINLSAAAATSMAKGESLSDTLRMVDAYADYLIMRHSEAGTVKFAAALSKHPVINAGDGGNQHPTQTCIDLYSILKMKGRISGTKVALVGDLKYSRTQRSLFYGLAIFGAKITLMAPKGLEMDPKLIEEVKKFKPELSFASEVSLQGHDIAYVCRIQKERFTNPKEAEKLQGSFKITKKNLPKDTILLHPLPKLDEISPEVDLLPQAKYFEQAKLGVPVRMALLAEVLGV